MFKFLKDLVDAFKEGASEGLAEAKEELAAKKAVETNETAAQLEAVQRRLATTPQTEKTAAALAAPYREVFLSELSKATDESRPPVFLFCIALPDSEITDWKRLLERDFGIRDSNDAIALASALTAGMGADADLGQVAVSLVRAAHAVTGAAGVGYLPAAKAAECCEPLAAMAAARFSSWHALGDAFIEGEAKAQGSNFLGRKFIAKAVKRLCDDARSPWQLVAWPSPTPAPESPSR